MGKSTACIVAFALSCGACLTPTASRGVVDVPRHQREGRVLDAAGRALAAAHVQVVGIAACADADPADVVSAMSDADGRFRVPLRADRRYRAWVVAADGVVSRLVAIGDGPITVRLRADDVVPPTQFVVDGAGAWRTHGPLRVEVALLDCEPLTVRGPLDANGAIDLLPLPDVPCQVRVFAAHCLVAATMEPQPVRAHFALGAPQSSKAKVVDDRQHPVPGASLYRLHVDFDQGRWAFVEAPLARRHHVATTAADGTADLLYAGDGEALFVAQAPAFAESVPGFAMVSLVDGAASELSPGGLVPFTLRAAPERRIPVRLPAVAPTGTIRLLGDVAWMISSPCVASGSPDAVTLPIVDGALLVHERRAWTAKALAIGGYSPTLAADDPFRPVPCTSTVFLPPSALDQPGGLDLGALVPVRVQVLDPMQRPAGGVRVACVASLGLGYDVDGLARATRGFSDGDGRVLLPAMPGRWFLVAEGAHAAAITPIEVRTGLAVQTLQLQPLACMRVRVLDAAGAPVVGVVIENRGSLGADGEDAFTFMMLAQTVDFDGVVTDHAGHADLRFLPGRGNRPRYRIERDGRKATGKVVAGDERVDIVLQ